MDRKSPLLQREGAVRREKESSKEEVITGGKCSDNNIALKSHFYLVADDEAEQVPDYKDNSVILSHGRDIHDTNSGSVATAHVLRRCHDATPGSSAKSADISSALAPAGRCGPRAGGAVQRNLKGRTLGGPSLQGPNATSEGQTRDAHQGVRYAGRGVSQGSKASVVMSDDGEACDGVEDRSRPSIGSDNDTIGAVSRSDRKRIILQQKIISRDKVYVDVEANSTFIQDTKEGSSNVDRSKTSSTDDDAMNSSGMGDGSTDTCANPSLQPRGTSMSDVCSAPPQQPQLQPPQPRGSMNVSDVHQLRDYWLNERANEHESRFIGGTKERTQQEIEDDVIDAARIGLQSSAEGDGRECCGGSGVDAVYDNGEWCYRETISKGPTIIISKRLGNSNTEMNDENVSMIPNDKNVKYNKSNNTRRKAFKKTATERQINNNPKIIVFKQKSRSADDVSEFFSGDNSSTKPIEIIENTVCVSSIIDNDNCNISPDRRPRSQSLFDMFSRKKSTGNLSDTDGSWELSNSATSCESIKSLLLSPFGYKPKSIEHQVYSLPHSEISIVNESHDKSFGTEGTAQIILPHSNIENKSANKNDNNVSNNDNNINNSGENVNNGNKAIVESADHDKTDQIRAVDHEICHFLDEGSTRFAKSETTTLLGGVPRWWIDGAGSGFGVGDGGVIGGGVSGGGVSGGVGVSPMRALASGVAWGAGVMRNAIESVQPEGYGRGYNKSDPADRAKVGYANIFRRFDDLIIYIYI